MMALSSSITPSDMPHPNQKLIDAIHLNKVVIFRAPGSTWRDMDKSTGSMVWQSLIHADGAFEFKLKPKMVTINGVDVVAPLTEASPKQAVYVLDNDGTSFITYFDERSPHHADLLKARAMFSQEHEAEAFHKAFIKFLDS